MLQPDNKLIKYNKKELEKLLHSDLEALKVLIKVYLILYLDLLKIYLITISSIRANSIIIRC
nr:MAG TPA: hypothetical protein [Caudoviricetes sp.]